MQYFSGLFPKSVAFPTAGAMFHVTMPAFTKHKGNYILQIHLESASEDTYITLFVISWNARNQGFFDISSFIHETCHPLIQPITQEIRNHKLKPVTQ